MITNRVRAVVPHVISRSFVLSTLVFSFTLAQSSVDRSSIPKREVRAVWVATVMGLDWPKSFDPFEQQRSLGEIVEKLHRANFNTIFFQVRGRADAMYRSRYEPWSQALTGELGRDPGWDPLAFLLNEAHARGMEVHAWFNTFLARTGNGSPPRVNNYPDWIRQADGGEWWFDPGIPDVRAYILNVALDIVRNYNIDGMHFDFVRYPARDFPDDETFRRYGKGRNGDDWRRENINQFVEAFHDSITIEKPMLKIGSTPVGLYTNVNGSRGLQGYSEVFQDSRRWLQEGWQDYLAPQVYWPLGRKGYDPDFASVARDWLRSSNGRHIYVGIGAYKPEVFSQLAALVDSARGIGAAGVSFFRYENIKGALDLGGRFRYHATLPQMWWKDRIPPNPPQTLRAVGIADNIFNVSWTVPLPTDGDDELKCFNVYRSSNYPVDVENPSNLVSVVGGNSVEYTDTIDDVQAPRYYYAVSAVDGGNNESVPATVGVIPPAIAELSNRSSYRSMLGALRSVSSVIYVPYEVSVRVPVFIKLLDARNNEVLSVVDAVQSPGRYVAAADVSTLPDGAYTCMMLAGKFTQRRTVQIDN